MKNPRSPYGSVPGRGNRITHVTNVGYGVPRLNGRGRWHKLPILLIGAPGGGLSVGACLRQQFRWPVPLLTVNSLFLSDLSEQRRTLWGSPFTLKDAFGIVPR